MTTRKEIKIAAVSYLNTIPFLYGIRLADNLRADLLLSPPSGCARSFISGEADIALIPVGALTDEILEQADIVTSFCIGASEPVRTVTLMSDSPLRSIRRIWLDGHSETSVRLARVLASECWKISPEWLHLEDYSVLEAPAEGDAFVLIGDKVFAAEGKFRYTWDLAAEWQEQYGLPFVFAVWIARKGVVDEETVDALEEALTTGVERIYESIVDSAYASFDDAYMYLTRNIDYLFDGAKRRALDRFREKVRRLPALRILSGS